MIQIKETILRMSEEIRSEVISFRRRFHMNPELSFEEYETSSIICSFLDENGIRYRKDVAGTGIIGEIKGSLPGGKVVALRAEMDALPLNERNVTSYSSSRPGKMHACGHDAHMAMLLGAAKLLNGLKDSFAGTILLIFQPGEELAPGGARLMIESGAFNDPKPDIVLAQHVLPELETGKVGYKAGRYMASSDEIYITISGKGGHAALPAASTDQIYIASLLVVKLKETIGSQKAKGIPTVLGIGRIRGDGATNVIPEKVEIAGTFRTFDEKWRAEAKELIKNISSEMAGEKGVSIEVRIVQGYPVLKNDEKLTARAIELSSELLGKDNVEIFEFRMSSEDFAYFTEAFPSVYFRAGIKKRGEAMKNLHSPEFDIDEEALETGVANLCWLTVNFLSDN
ncbi:MAG: M20 family metallopeptidase [Bacteroidales bacterium]|jgi:amidohydrolase